MFTQLNGRKLWYDGSVTVEAENLILRLKLGNSVKGIFVEKMTPEIEKFNRFVSKENRITIHENSAKPNDYSWNIPDNYKQLDIPPYVFGKAIDLIDKERLTPEQRMDRFHRLEKELNLYMDYGLFDVLKVMIYIIDTFKEKSVVWGVGRGSSVSSYVLYVLGVHDIDSVKFELEIEDFLKPNKYKDTNPMETQNG